MNTNERNIAVSVPSGELHEALAGTPGIDLIAWDCDGPAPRDQIDIVVPPYRGSNRRLERLAGCEVGLVQLQMNGYEGVGQYLTPGQLVANASGVHDTSTAELAVALMLASQRGLPDFIRAADEERWEYAPMPSLADRRVLIVGYGGIGKAIESRLAGFEVEIARLARTARTEQNLAGGDVHVHGFDELHAQLALADVVVLITPLTEQTRHLLDAGALAALPDGALVVNVARGAVIDTDALVAELSTGRIRAALDVTDPEPLPAGHPLWRTPGTIVVPHVGGGASSMLPRMRALVLRQVEHLRAGEPYENLVTV